MCTAVLSLSPEREWPVLLACTRDEFRARSWSPPARWWPQRDPELLGGRDEREGGTWLAVNAAARRVAVVLNRIEPTALSDERARSRGALPLLVASEGGEALGGAGLDLVRPFNLLLAEAGRATWWRYDGRELTRHEVEPGLHILTAANLDDMSNPRQRYWLPRFREAAGPDPRPGEEAPAGWGEWPELLADVDTPYDDPRAMNVRRGGDEGPFGTVSAAMLAVSDAALRYEFCPGPPQRTRWERVL